MRWDDLFADLEAQADALAVAERAAEVDERARVEFGAVAVGDRLGAALGLPVRLDLLGDTAIAGTVARVGADWLLLDEGHGREALVVTSTIRTASGLPRHSVPPGAGGAVRARLTLRSALRGVARDRSGARLHTVDGAVIEATLDRVGADFVEAARHAAGEARRRAEVRDVVLVPFTALTAVRRAVG